MAPPVTSTDMQRLTKLYENAVAFTNDRLTDASRISREVASEKTQYFEKIALGSGAIIAALVSFLGSHSVGLHPRWLLRAVLITFTLSTVFAMYRNWRYPYYLILNTIKQHFAALLEQQRRKNDLLLTNRVGSIEDGKAIDLEEWQKDFAKSDADGLTLQKVQTKREGRLLTELSCVEIATYVTAIAGVFQLVSLAWINF